DSCERPLAGGPRPTAPWLPGLGGLEDRPGPTTFYVDDSLTAGATVASLGGRVTIDRDASGTLTDRDQVTFGLGEFNQTATLTFRSTPSNEPPVAGDVGTAFQFLNNAFASPPVVTNDLILVATGTYAENVAYTKAVTLQGSGSAATVLTGTGTGLTITAASAGLSSFTLQNYTLGFSAAAPTTLLTLADVKLLQTTTGGVITGVTTVFIGGTAGDDIYNISTGGFDFDNPNPTQNQITYSNVTTLTFDGSTGSDTYVVTFGALTPSQDIKDMGATGTDRVTIHGTTG